MTSAERRRSSSISEGDGGPCTEDGY